MGSETAIIPICSILLTKILPYFVTLGIFRDRHHNLRDRRAAARAKCVLGNNATVSMYLGPYAKSARTQLLQQRKDREAGMADLASPRQQEEVCNLLRASRARRRLHTSKPSVLAEGMTGRACSYCGSSEFFEGSLLRSSRENILLHMEINQL